MRRLLQLVATRAGWTSRAIDMLVTKAEVVRASAGSRVGPAGGAVDDFVRLLIRGAVREDLRIPGQPDVTTGILGPGEFLCVPPPVVAREDLHTEMTVHEQATIALVSQSTFLQAIGTLPADHLARLTSWIWRRRTRVLLRKIQLLNFGVMERIEHELVNLARGLGRPGPHGVVIPVVISETHLAGMVAASRTSVSRCVARLRGAGLVDRVGKGWMVSDQLMAGQRLRDAPPPHPSPSQTTAAPVP